jgi:amidohydrolase
VDINTLKSKVMAEIDGRQPELANLSRRIHANPELGFQEKQAAGWLTEYLEKNGFSVERGICQFPTAFRACYGQNPPVIALLAEYDALPQIGHACGHNLIAVSSVAAGIGAKSAVDQTGGQVVVIGAPAEELYAGKQVMARRDAFSGLDAAMMVHPGSHNSAVTEALACQRLDIEFFGKAAHAAARPEAGINALEAMILAFNAIDALRQHIGPKCRVHGIITDGGSAANVVPAHSAGNFLVRAQDDKNLADLKLKVLNCFIGAATATGARLEYKWEEDYYAPMLNNLTIGRLYVNNMRRLGRQTSLQDKDTGFGSTDFGNVSQLVPGMHANIAIGRNGIPIHTPQFAKAAGSEAGMEAMLLAAKGLALTVTDLLARPENLAKARKEFFKGQTEQDKNNHNSKP